MSHNALKLPKLGTVIILLLYVVEDLIVGQDFLIRIIVYRAPKLVMGAIVEKLAIVLFNGLNNVHTKELSIFFGVKKEGSSN